MTTYERTVRERISTILVESERTHAELSADLDIPYNTLTSYIYRRATPSAERLGRICKGLGASADWVLGIKEDQI